LSARPLLVSRGRKRPETLFIEDQARKEGELAFRSEQLRRRIDWALNRVYRATHALEQRAADQPSLFEMRRSQILDSLKQPLKSLLRLRDQAKAEASEIDALQSRLEKSRMIVAGMRTVEDEYRERPPFWRRLVKRS
jgi:hypothetical protein